MAKHINLKEYINGYEISISIDDNLCNRFRYEIAIFSHELNGSIFTESIIKKYNGHDIGFMAKDIVKAERYARGLSAGKFVGKADFIASPKE